VLKGGLALDLRFGDRARATRDLDLGRHDDEGAALEDFRAVEAHDAGDFFVCSVTRTDRLDGADVEGAVRFHARFLLAGAVFEDLVVDVGFSSSAIGPPDRIPSSDFFSFTGAQPVELPVIPLAQHVAEKVHAYVRAYGPQGVRSTRVKDLVDMVLIQANAGLLAGDVRAALSAVFGLRGSQLPAALPLPPEAWRVPYRRMATSLAIPVGLGEGYRLAAAFLTPILDGSVDGTRIWDPEQKQWSE
jgi:hypothetical protein